MKKVASFVLPIVALVGLASAAIAPKPVENPSTVHADGSAPIPSTCRYCR
jgi:hypothetical protein